MLHRFLSLALTASLAASLAACSGGGGHSAASSLLPQSTKSAKQHVRHLKSRTVKEIGGAQPGFNASMNLGDAPIVGMRGAQFNAGILGVDAIDENGDSWQLTGSDTPTVINVLSLRRTTASLGTGTLPAGTYPAIQLLLDPSTTQFVYGGQTYPVAITDPNHPWWDSSQSIEAVTIPLTISGNDGDSITATLDFNMFQSADFRDGVLYLTPTVAAGIGEPAISGIVANAAGQPVQNATIVATDASGNVANVTVSGGDGSFMMHGISAGSYTVSVTNTYTTAAGDTLTASGADAGAAPSTSAVVGPNSTLNVGTLTD